MVKLIEGKYGHFKTELYPYLISFPINQKPYYECSTKEEAVHKEILICYEEIDRFRKKFQFIR